jgi:hypothetical protein
MDELTPEQVAAFADDALAQLQNPAGYALAKAQGEINAKYDAMDAVADDATKEKLDTLRQAELAALEPVAVAPPAHLTVDDLGVPLAKSGAKSALTLSQSVELERDGQPWCTWEDAEQMLVLAAKVNYPGMKGYTLTRDEEAMTLTLALS